MQRCGECHHYLCIFACYRKGFYKKVLTNRNYKCSIYLQTTIVVCKGGILMKDISKSELEVMQFLWRNGESTSVEIVKNVSAKNDWKSNTIMTLVSRLVTKGFVESVKNKGELIIYKPLISEYDYKSKETNNFIEKMYDGSINNLLVAFAKSKKLTKQDLEDLIKLVDD